QRWTPTFSRPNKLPSPSAAPRDRTPSRFKIRTLDSTKHNKNFRCCICSILLTFQTESARLAVPRWKRQSVYGIICYGLHQGKKSAFGESPGLFSNSRGLAGCRGVDGWSLRHHAGSYSSVLFAGRQFLSNPILDYILEKGHFSSLESS